MIDADRALYVYALADPGLPAAMQVLGRRLRTVTVGAVSAVVERRGQDGEPSTEALRLQHDIVARLATRAPALLPARFGSITDEATLRRLLTDRSPDILESLANVRGKWQMTIRLFGEPELPDATPTPCASGTDFLRRRQQRAHHVLPEVTAIRAALEGLVAAERVDRGQGTLRVTVFHLVASGRLRAYTTKAAALRLPPHQVVVSGPWPAFAFTPELF